MGFLVFYLLCGAGANLGQWAAEPGSMVPTIEASGAIAGVMGGYLLLFPKPKVDVPLILVFLVRVVPVTAWIMLLMWLGLQVLSGLVANPLEGSVACWADAGGLVIAFVLVAPVLLRRGGAESWRRTEGYPPYSEATYGSQSPTREPMSRPPR